MRFIVDDSIQSLFPELVVGVFWGSLGSLRSHGEATIREMQQQSLIRLQDRIPDENALCSHENIIAWRLAYEQFGVVPRKKDPDTIPTHESFCRMLLKKRAWRSYGPVVDVYLSNQVDHLLPHGGYDSSLVRGDLHLAVSAGGETFDAMDGSREYTDVGEVVYRDREQVLTRRWNRKDGISARITGETTSVLLMIESPSSAISYLQIESSITDLRGRFERCFTGEFFTQVVRCEGCDLASEH